MNRQQYSFSRWCDRVVSYIYYPPDREEIKQELMWHLEDTAEALAEQGLSEDEAAQKAMEAMGDAGQLGKLLRRVHKPWLSWACWVTVTMAAILAIALLSNIFVSHGWGIGQEIKHLFRPEVNYENYYEHYSLYRYLDENGNLAERVEYPSLVAELRAGGEKSCGIYSFRVTNGWITESDAGYDLHLVLSFSSPRFWAGPPAQEFFRVETSTGRTGGLMDGVDIYYHWPSISETANGEYVIILRQLDEGTEWVDIACDKGEGFAIRTYLPNGGDWA